MPNTAEGVQGFTFRERTLGLAVDHINRVERDQPHTLEQVLWAAAGQIPGKDEIPRNPDFVIGDEHAFMDPGPQDVFAFAEQSGQQLGRILSVTRPNVFVPSLVEASPTATIDMARQSKMDGVAVQAHTIGAYEEEMLEHLQKSAQTASAHGLQVVGVLYPRARHVNGGVEDFTFMRDSNDPDDTQLYTRMVARGVIKATEYKGISAFKVPVCAQPEQIVSAANGIPVYLAGGARVSAEQTLTDVSRAMKAGYAGAIVGRGIFDAPQPDRMVHALQAVIRADMSPGKAMKLAGIKG